ncbi:serine/threonine protein kinase, partial [Streptomyces spiralis]
TALAVVTVAVAVLAVTHHLPGAGGGGSTAASGTSGPPPATAPGGPAEGSTPPRATVSPSATAAVPPSGFRVYHAPEGFSVALPSGWQRLSTTRAPDRAYRVVFGAAGDTRTLAVTHSEDVGPDPVTVWRDDVEPGLERQQGYRRIGGIRSTTYQGRRAADMEWLSGTPDRRVHTFGRGVLLGGRRGFSLRWTTPADAYGTSANRRALEVLLSSFRPATG